MTAVPASTGGAAAAAAAIAQATKASGVIVRLDPEDFLTIVNQNAEPLAVHVAPGGWFSYNHQYLTSYRGLAFYTKQGQELPLPPHCQVIEARKIWIPG